MTCYAEAVLERVAAVALDLGIHLADGPETWRPRDAALTDGDVDQVLAHARSCVRCRELLQVFQDTEMNLRAQMSSAVRPTRIRLEAIGLQISGEDLPPTDEVAAYAVAADSGQPGADSLVVGEEPVLSLASADGRFLVRIFRKSTGPGATAVLLRGDLDRAGDAALQGPPQPANVALDIEGVEYVFDEKGMADLPRFPAQTVALVIR